jgi:putative ABC transport system permease protein
MLSVRSTFDIAFEALRRNVMRSVLTALGIIIGVAAVIVMMALGNGARASIESRISSLGTRVVTVSAGSATVGGVRLGQGAVVTLTAADADAIAREVRGVDAVSPGVTVRSQVAAPAANWSTQVQGTSEALPAIRDWSIELGSFFDEHDVAGGAKVAVLGAAVRDQLFGAGADPVGQTVRINSQPFKVIGVLARKGQGPMGQDQDDTLVVPYTTAQRRLLGITHVSSITVSASEDMAVSSVAADVADLLRVRHRIEPGAADDFTIRTFEEMASVLTSTTTTMSYLLAGVAAVSLLVGGIGIMNIMLVSVTERTREVGLRLSLGARRRDVQRQFLVEALALGLAGGAVGVVAGIGVSLGLSSFLQWTTAVSPASVAMSFGFAAAIGGFFGFYPARRAASLSPMNALRYE